MAYSCRVCGAISPTRNCPAHTAAPRANARASATMRATVIMRDHHTCQLCGNPVPRGSERLDHIVARANGGATTLGNLQLTCEPCNLRKGST